ncbi:hypothetical protein [Zunongwangia sp. HGR-M22]|uniref:hypothetical protein n=1 Tax=Zunongwangia sp. HGR-M22 TaxID=3015168 RepID=UPI0022DD6D83|nr:hypothetical protein [Zunongwangia sp. HGR-M22]WBL25106.1 hypothetical protein PBT91_14530 [Zunongwangia sp. HGR-M22]
MNKTELKARCKELGISTEGLDTNAKLEAAIQAKEAELAKVEKEQPETSEEQPEISEEELEEKGEDPAPDHYKDDRGRKWKFKANTPKKLRIDGHPMSQEEILGTEEVIAELVLGNCSFLTQIIE